MKLNTIVKCVDQVRPQQQQRCQPPAHHHQLHALSHLPVSCPSATSSAGFPHPVDHSVSVQRCLAEDASLWKAELSFERGMAARPSSITAMSSVMKIITKSLHKHHPVTQPPQPCQPVPTSLLDFICGSLDNFHMLCTGWVGWFPARLTATSQMERHVVVALSYRFWC